MLNISNNNKINENIEKYNTYKNLSERPHYKILNKIFQFLNILVKNSRVAHTTNNHLFLRPKKKIQNNKTQIE